MPERFRFMCHKQSCQFIFAAKEHAFRHAIVQRASEHTHIARTIYSHYSRAFNLCDRAKPSVPQDISRFARPRRLRPHARCNPNAVIAAQRRTFAQQFAQPHFIYLCAVIHQQHIHPRRFYAAHSSIKRAQLRTQSFCFK